VPDDAALISRQFSIDHLTLDGIRATAHTARLLTENLQINHRIPKENIFVVLNQRTKQSTFTAATFHKKEHTSSAGSRRC
jgi:hypothetical protein